MATLERPVVDSVMTGPGYDYIDPSLHRDINLGTREQFLADRDYDLHRRGKLSKKDYKRLYGKKHGHDGIHHHKGGHLGMDRYGYDNYGYGRIVEPLGYGGVSRDVGYGMPIGYGGTGYGMPISRDIGYSGMGYGMPISRDIGYGYGGYGGYDDDYLHGRGLYHHHHAYPMGMGTGMGMGGGMLGGIERGIERGIGAVERGIGMGGMGGGMLGSRGVGMGPMGMGGLGPMGMGMGGGYGRDLGYGGYGYESYPYGGMGMGGGLLGGVERGLERGIGGIERGLGMGGGYGGMGMAPGMGGIGGMGMGGMGLMGMGRGPIDEGRFLKLPHYERINENPNIDNATLWRPRSDIFDVDQDHLRVEFELPGVPREDISLTIQDNILTLAALKPQTRKEEVGFHYQNERHFGKFYRRMMLPFSVDANKVKAHMDNGVLKVHLVRLPGVSGGRIPIGEGLLGQPQMGTTTPLVTTSGSTLSSTTAPLGTTGTSGVSTTRI